MNNSLEILSKIINLVPAKQNQLTDIFGFGEFVSALALLIIVYTTTNNLYKFRLSIVPFALRNISYGLLIVIGIGTLLMEVWFSKHWLIPKVICDYTSIQFFFATLFLLVIFVWIYYAFINSPVFSKRNYKKYMQEIYRLIINGSNEDLIMLASEINRSSESIIKASSEVKTEYKKEDDTSNNLKPYRYLQPKDEFAQSAYEMVLLIANKKFCKSVVEFSPVTVIKFINAIETSKKYHVPIGQFLSNISTELISNKNSILYSETEKYTSDLIGNNKLFIKSMYGNCKLLDALDFLHPYHIDYEVRNRFDEEQYKAFTHVTLITIESYLKHSGVYFNHFRPLNDACNIIKESTNTIYKLNSIKNFDEITAHISYKKLTVTVDFIREFIELLEQCDLKRYKITKKPRDKHYIIHSDMFDVLVDIIFETMWNLTSLKLNAKNIWWIQHNMFWSEIFGLRYQSSNVMSILTKKLQRRLYDEIMTLKKYNNFKSTKILGFVLNILGLELRNNGLYKDWRGFHKVILIWTGENYHKLYIDNKKMAKSCLIGYIDYDKNNIKLIDKRSKKYLNLNTQK
uniref:hypothetical protein n=1 Tax=Aliarcobacter sp. TaxID=2321116 RepID=UPI0040470A20